MGVKILSTEGVRNLAQRTIEVLQAVPVARWHYALCALLVIWLAVSLAPLPWLVLSSKPVAVSIPDYAPDMPAQSQTSGPRIDLARLQSLGLFGKVDANASTAAVTVPEEDITAEKTRLQIQLMGIVSASDNTSALAIIAHQNKQDHYAVGDSLPVGSRVTLSKVLVDHVIISNNGRYESLWLYEEDNNNSNASRASSQADSRNKDDIETDLRDRSTVTNMAREYRQRLYKNPTSLAQVVRITPAIVDGAPRGFQVNPGSDREQFAAFGFKPGDVVTSVNGVDLTNPSQAVEVYKLMREASEAVFTVEREGQPLQIAVSLSENE